MPSTEASVSPAAATAPAGTPDPKAMQEVIAELQEVGALDPAAREELMADMRQTDPGMWPELFRVFRASAAYRRRTGQDQFAATGGNRLAAAGQISPHPVSPLPPKTQPAQPEPQSVAEPEAQPGQRPTADDPFAHHWPPARDGVDGRPRIIPASYELPATSSDWQAQLVSAIEALQAEVRKLQSQQRQWQRTPGKQPAEARKIKDMLASGEAQLRILYLLAGRREEAVEAIESMPAALREFWSAQLYALDSLLDTERMPDTTARAGRAKRALNDAIAYLGEAAPLSVRNLVFCTAVQSYGSTTRFDQNEFVPEQEVLLYAEVENFTSESTPKGYHTALRSSYQILDNRGQRVADHQYTKTEEYCQRPRRDYFIGYHLRLPKRIYPGTYTLLLTIEDLKSQKFGQSSIELSIKDLED